MADTAVADSGEMEQPSIDRRSYRHLVLEKNGLRCLLVRDEETDKGAAAVSVGVGQMHDPPEFPGLAHLTEHLLMMGTAKYPSENEYDRYLSGRGGHSNAYTDLELTCYYLDCDAGDDEGFRGALDRFAQFFVGPLLRKETVAKEIQAVDSEHAKNVQSDAWRVHQLARTVLGGGGGGISSKSSPTATTESSSSPQPQPQPHPYGSFGTGNKESLGAHDAEALAGAVRSFYERYYRAVNMTLCVVGKQPLETLEEWVAAYFSDVPAGDAERHRPPPLPPLAPRLPRRVDTVPTSDVTSIELQWPMRETQSLYLSKPTRFLSHLLGHEGPGSLLAALREKHWAQELMADDASKSTRGFSVFTVEIELTPSGYRNVGQVVKMVYAYLALLRDVPGRVFDELRASSDMQFRFLSKRPPSDTASGLAVQMQHHPPRHYLSGPYKLFVDAVPSERIRECWRYLTPENMLLVVSCKELKGTTDRVDPYYGTEYAERTIEPSLLAEWKKHFNRDDGDNSNISEEDAALISLLRLPDENDMLATNFDLVEIHTAFRGDAPLPRCLVDTPSCRLWYKPDTVFSQPKVNLVILLRTGAVYAASPFHSVLASLWVEFQHEHCKDFSYAASMAGLHCDFQNSRTGMEIHVSGYSHKAGILVRRIVGAVDTLAGALTDETFERIVDKVRNQFSSFLVGQPYQHAMYASDMCLEDPKWKFQDRMACLDEISPDDLTYFSKTLLSRFFMEVLVHGNVSPQEATEYTELIQNAWGAKAPYHLPTPRVVRLESDAMHRFRGWNEEDNNSCVLNVYQIGPVDIRTNGALSVLQHLMREPAFNQLRTEEQLGYIVHSSIKTSGANIKGWMCLIQSDSFDPVHMDERIEAFLVNMRSMLVGMSRDDFEANVAAVGHNLLEKNKNLGEESQRYWGVINNQTYRFRRLEEIAKATETLTKADALRLFDKYFLARSPTRRKLSVQVFGKNHASLLSDDGDGCQTSPCPKIEDPTQFVRSMPLYPVEPTVSLGEHMLKIENQLG